MKEKILFFAIIIIGITSDAQTVLLNVDRKDEQVISEYGPNLKKFTHIYIHAGLLASPDNPGARIIYGGSLNFSFGIRKKYKITSLYSLGYEIEGQFTDFKLKQETGKILPDTIINNISGRMDYYSLSPGFYNRFNFDSHRGNYMGSFLDIGVAGDWHISIKSVSRNKQTNGTELKSVVKHLPYANNLGAKLFARIGLSHISIYSSYRITELFKSSWNYPDLPRLIIGMELALF